MFKILFGLCFSFHWPISTNWKNHRLYDSRAWVSEQTMQLSKITKPIATAQIDRYVKNKQEFSDFWAISYCFVQIVMLIIIKMHFVLLTTISLLFFREGHFWIILKKASGSSPQSPTMLLFWKERKWQRKKGRKDTNGPLNEYSLPQVNALH